MTHPEFPSFKEVGHIDVDAGSIWVGDGCYVFGDPGQPRPKDFGDEWSDICNRFFERSGYDACQDEASKWQSKQNTYALMHPESRAFVERQNEIASKWPKEVWAEHDKLMSTLKARYEKDHPFEPKAEYTGCANFTHDAGHGGMGMMISSFEGDGTYPVYIEYDDNKRPRRVLIDFDPSCKGNELEERQADVDKVRAALESMRPSLLASLEEKGVCKECVDILQELFEKLKDEIV